MEAISRFVDEPKINELTDIMQAHCSQIVSIYVQSKLTPPRGLKQSLTDDEVYINLDMDDRVAYANELSYIGNMSRVCLGHVMPLLTTSIHQCLTECSQLLQIFISNLSSLSQYIHKLEHLYDDLHWLFLISTYVLADVVQGETPCIPQEVMAYSIAIQESYSNVFEMHSVVLENYDDTILQVDPVVALILSLYHWCVLEKGFVDAGLKDIVSPQLCETVIWALETVLCPYLMMKEANYPQVSLAIFDKIYCNTDTFHIDQCVSSISIQSRYRKCQVVAVIHVR